MKVRPAGREDCACRSPYNKILEQLDALASDIASAADIARDAYDVANARAGQASQYAQDARDAADDALLHAQGAQQSADDALVQAAASAGSASDAADSAADALQTVQDIQQEIATVLAQDIGNKLDKLTTAGVWLYSHNGSTQGEVQPVVAPTAATIPIRDTNGYVYGATNATGTRDPVLTNGIRVQNDLDAYAPMVRTTGNQNIAGNKTWLGTMTITANQQYISRLRLRNESMSRSEYGTLRRETQIVFTDINDSAIGMLMLVRLPNGLNTFTARIYDKNGNYHDTVLSSYQDTP